MQQDELLNAIYSVMSRTDDKTSDDARAITEQKAKEPSPQSFSQAGPVSRSLRILVAEDSEFNALLMEKLLLRRGHAVTLVNNGRDAVNRANAADFDVLLLDVHMPELDGFDVIREVRERERAHGGDEHLPVIALTARSRTEDRERCLAAGMDDFLSKPIQTDELWATIDRVTGGPIATAKGLFDSRILLAACGGDAAALKSICQALRARLPENLAAVGDALRDQDSLRLREAAHKLAGMVSAFSTSTGSVALEIEDLASRSELKPASKLVVQLNAMTQELLRTVGDLTIEKLQRQDDGRRS
jgi:CheY-like chemotaxis protein